MKKRNRLGNLLVAHSLSLSLEQDYQPLDVAAAYVAPVKQKESSRTGALPRFEGHTKVKDVYKRWDVQPRKRYVDFHETNNYVPPQVRVRLSVRHFVCLSACLSACLSVCPSVCPSVRLLVCRSVS